MTTSETLRYLGITRNYRGYQQICIAVRLVNERPERLHHITHEVYDVVAEQCECSPLCIERNIRTIILKAWHCSHTRFCEITGCNLIKPPTAAEFIDILSTCYHERKIG